MGELLKYDFSQRPHLETSFNTPKNDIIKDKEEDNMNDKYITKDELNTHSQLLTSQFDNKLSQLEGKIDSQSKIIDEKFNTLNAKMDGKFEVVDEKFNTLNATIEGKFDSLNAKIDSLTKLIWWIMGIIGTGVIIAIISAIIKNFFTK